MVWHYGSEAGEFLTRGIGKAGEKATGAWTISEDIRMNFDPCWEKAGVWEEREG